MTVVVIIGAGPAGLGAAAVLARAGVQVTVLERQGQPGGVPRLCGHSPFGMREFHRVMGGQAYAARLAGAAVAAGARLLLNHAVTGIDPGPTLRVATPDGEVALQADRILLATGAREASRAERFLPGERPLGIVTTGALQDLWFQRSILPFRRPVILGSELVAMSAVLTCRQAGAKPLAIVEPADWPLAPAPFRWLPRTLGIPLRTGTSIEDILSRDGRLHQLVLRDGAGRISQLECDGLVLSGSFRPESGMARMCGVQIDPATGGPVVDQSGRTSRADIYAAGNLLRGIETAGQCWAEGRAVALAMMADLATAPQTASPPAPDLEVRPGAGLRYVMPQRLRADASAALPCLQIRLDRPMRGSLTLRDASGRRLASQPARSAPERRLTLALAPLPLQDATGPLTLTMEQA